MNEQQAPANINGASNTPPVNESSADLVTRLDKLIDSLNNGKKRDVWDRFQIIASFISSVLFAGVGLYFTTVYNNREARRQDHLQKATLSREEREENRQIEMQSIQKDITQLEAIIKLTPLLASKDKETRRYAMISLEALNKNKSLLDIQSEISDTTKKNKDVRKTSKPNLPSASDGNSMADQRLKSDPQAKFDPSSDLLNTFAQIALAEGSPLTT